MKYSTHESLLFIIYAITYVLKLNVVKSNVTVKHKYSSEKI